jgi:hypothetical protein
MISRWFLLTPLIIACSPEVVALQGIVTTDSPSSGEAAEGALVRVLTGGGEQYAEQTTGAHGLFRVDAPAGESVHLIAQDADGFESSFRGVSGMNPRLLLPPGTIHTFGDAVRTDWMTRMDGCEGVGEGAFTVGQIRVDLIDETTGEAPIVRDASVDVFNEFGELVRTGCYLDAEGESFDADATLLGESGLFGVFGLPAGRMILRIEASLVADELRLYEFDLWMPEEGVAPRFPIVIPFEL